MSLTHQPKPTLQACFNITCKMKVMQSMNRGTVVETPVWKPFLKLPFCIQSNVIRSTGSAIKLEMIETTCLKKKAPLTPGRLAMLVTKKLFPSKFLKPKNDSLEAFSGNPIFSAVREWKQIFLEFQTGASSLYSHADILHVPECLHRVT